MTGFLVDVVQNFVEHRECSTLILDGRSKPVTLVERVKRAAMEAGHRKYGIEKVIVLES